jgi:hypothetical protein
MLASPAVGRIAVVVSPGARTTELVGRHGDAWKVRVVAAPEKGRANAAVEELLGGLLGVPVAVVAGASSRRKVVEVSGLDSAEADRRLEAS